jgi:hypothetical protein
MQLILGKENVEEVDLVNSVRGDEFTCDHNRDSKVFMIGSKFEHFISHELMLSSLCIEISSIRWEIM